MAFMSQPIVGNHIAPGGIAGVQYLSQEVCLWGFLYANRDRQLASYRCEKGYSPSWIPAPLRSLR